MKLPSWRWVLGAVGIAYIAGGLFPILSLGATYSVWGDGKSPAAVNVILAVNPPILSPSEVRAFVISRAKSKGVNTAKADWIIKHESDYCWLDGSYNTALPGDNGKSIGCWQFNLSANPDVSYACASDLTCSTDLFLNWVLQGAQDPKSKHSITSWTTYAFCREWYPDCPF